MPLTEGMQSPTKRGWNAIMQFFHDKRGWIGVAILIALLVLLYAGGWLGRGTPEPDQQEASTE